jgi:hypothetical protein
MLGDFMRKIILALLLCCASTAARADWQNTHWSMSVDEVHALYPDAQSLAPEQLKQLTTPAHVPQLFVPYAEDGYGYKAYFYFAPGTQRLSMVQLYLEPGGDSAALLKSLLDRYGKGETDIGPNNAMKVRVQNWKVDGDAVTYAFFPELAPSTGVKYVGPSQAAPK